MQSMYYALHVAHQRDRLQHQHRSRHRLRHVVLSGNTCKLYSYSNIRVLHPSIYTRIDIRLGEQEARGHLSAAQYVLIQYTWINEVHLFVDLIF